MVKELITYVVQQLATHPNDVEVFVITSGDKNRIEIKVHDDDRGKIIGREGQTIRAIRMLANAVAPSTEDRISVDIIK